MGFLTNKLVNAFVKGITISVGKSAKGVASMAGRGEGKGKSSPWESPILKIEE